MFDKSPSGLDAFASRLVRVDRDLSDAERVDRLAALERVKAACAAAQARLTVDLAESQEEVAGAWRQRAKECADVNDFEGWRAARESARRASVVTADSTGQARTRSRSRRLGSELGVAGQVALARRESPSSGARHLTLALRLVRDLPMTLAALETGLLSEWRAELVARETAVLSAEQRRAVDAELFEGIGADQVGALGDRELARRVRAIAYRLDAESVMARCRGAEKERRVSIRPAPDTMTYVTAYLPVAQGVALHSALTVAAATAKAAGDDRSRGQAMADTLVERVTGQASAAAVPVEVQVVITDRALLTNAFGSGDDTPAQVPGYGTVPAAWARTLVRGSQEAAARVWLRRLYTHPDDGTLVGMESTKRLFEAGLRRFLVARDGTCRTPWCDAPIRHLDHVVDHASGGPTTADNGQGLCVRCNHIKQLPGWRARPEPDPPSLESRPHTAVTTTPTGHSYASQAPPVLPGYAGRADSMLERHLEILIVA
ncbi:MAG: DUF222 domain-containing protein [Actinomycetota bacterium]|uniref:HNH endonuclease n=1 Tax=Lapillicoccus sp. TaxID=1909287 RepID=UPI0027C18C00|nr:DUF222 domain-containing protein [Actinomycetota bacterium]